MLLEWNMDTFVNIFGDSAAWMLIFAGCMAMIWFFYEGYRNGGFIHHKKEDIDKYDNVSKILKIIIVLGMILGLLEIATGIVTIMLNLPPSDAFAVRYGSKYDLLTSILLMVLGISMFLKPMLDAPLSALIGLIAAVAVGIIISIFIPQAVIDVAYQETGYNPRYIIIIISAIVGILVGMMAKFAIGSLETIAKVISWPPIALLITLVCFVQGFGLLFKGFTLANLI